MDNFTEKKAANMLLKRGVKVQVATPLFLRILGKKTMELEIKAPLTEDFLDIAVMYLEMNIENTGEMTLNEAFTLYIQHGKKMSEIIARCVRKKGFPTKWLSNLLRKSLTQEELSYLFHLVIIYGGIEDFIGTIRLAEATRITKPMSLSPAEETS